MWHHHSQLCQHPRRQPELRIVPLVQPTKQPPVLQREQPTSLQPPRLASDAAEGPWLERPLAILSPNGHVLLVALQVRGGPSAESSCSDISCWNKFTAAAIVSQSDYRTRVKCRMWICSEMLVLMWMYLSSHRPLHLSLTLYNPTCLSAKNQRTCRSHTEKWDQDIIRPPILLPA